MELSLRTRPCAAGRRDGATLRSVNHTTLTEYLALFGSDPGRWGIGTEARRMNGRRILDDDSLRAFTIFSLSFFLNQIRSLKS